jgi:phospholipase/carboxylesterase
MCRTMEITRRRFLAAVGAAAAAGATRPLAADTLGPGQYPLRLDNSRDGMLYVPKGYSPEVPAPLIVMFHGAGGSGRSTDYVYPLADERGLIVLSPDSRDERTWDMIIGAAGPDVDFLGAALRQTAQRCRVDRSRMMIGGHSDGASYALCFGIGVGDMFTQIIALSPGVMTPVAANGKPRLFLAHGVSDHVMPIDDTSRKFVPRLRALGYDVTYREYDGGHGAPAPIVRESIEWLRL